MSEQWDPDAFRTRVRAALEEFIDEQEARLAPLGEDVRRLTDQARRSVAGGKRLRAAFCYWGFRAVAGEPTPDQESAIVRAGAAIELLQASALVHDDIMDDSDTRRGQPSAHRALEAVHRDAGWSGPAQAYGSAAAILLGDLLLTWSDELLRRAGLPEGPTSAALDLFSLTRSEVISGQFLDISVQARGRAEVETAMTVLRYKSAKYSVERPLHIGAALGGGSREQLDALTGFGLPIGEAFQLRDDQLGVYGDPEVTGKPAGDDLVEGKRTVLVAYALEKAPAEAAARLDSALGTPLSPEDVAELRRIISDTGAPERVEELIADLSDRAVTALDDAVAAGLIGPAAAEQLRTLAVAATQRSL